MKNNYKLSVLALFALLFTFTKSHAQCTATTVPYYEGFASVTTASPLPNCWARTNTVTCLTFTNTQQAGFYYTPINSNYFWSRGVQLNVGVVYSISIAYSTVNTVYNTWTNFSVLLGTNQNTTGLVSVLNASPALTSGFATLSSTFVVTTSGVYYVAINGNSNGTCCGYNMYFDDLSITAPCTVNPVNLITVASATKICLGESFTLSAQGADTYSWTGGIISPSMQTASSITTTPNGNTTFYVTGTNTLTGCATTNSFFLTVDPTPPVSIFSSTPTVCSGGTVNLFANGASTYIWSNGSNAANISITPTVTTTYSLSGLNNFGCGATATLQIPVMPLPTITAVSSKTQSCANETVNLIATGGVSYTWTSSGGAASGATVTIIPTNNLIYTVAGTGTNGCVHSASLQLHVSACAGIASLSADEKQISVYPNPSRDSFVISTALSGLFQLEVYDVAGKMVLAQKNVQSGETINTNSLKSGVYVIKLNTGTKSYSLKMAKE